MDIFIRLRTEIGRCPYCGQETFYTFKGSHDIPCMECGKRFPLQMLCKSKIRFCLSSPAKISLWTVDSSLEDIRTQVAEVVKNPKDPRLLGLRNLSQRTWSVNLPDGSQRPLPPQQVVPVRAGFEIHFLGGTNDSGIIK